MNDMLWCLGALNFSLKHACAEHRLSADPQTDLIGNGPVIIILRRPCAPRVTVFGLCVCVCVCVCVYAYFYTTGKAADDDQYQWLQCYKRLKNKKAIILQSRARATLQGKQKPLVSGMEQENQLSLKAHTNDHSNTTKETITVTPQKKGNAHAGNESSHMALLKLDFHHNHSLHLAHTLNFRPISDATSDLKRPLPLANYYS